MSLYSDYIEERTTDRIIECDTGFATYRYVNDGRSVFILDIYTVPSARRSGAGKRLAETIVALAKEKGCTELMATVVPSMAGSTRSLRVALAYGMTLHSSGQDVVFFRKDI